MPADLSMLETWPIILLIAAFACAAHATVLDPNLHPAFEKIGVARVNLLLFASLGALVGVLLATIFSTDGPSPILSRVTLLLWFALTLTAAGNLPWRRSARAVVSILLLLLPISAAIYVAQRPDLREQLTRYQATVGELDSGSSLTDVMNFVFVRQPQLTCSSEDAQCLQLVREIEARDTVLMLSLRIVYWFLAFFCILRFYGAAYEVRERLSRSSTRDYDLKRGVVAQSAAVLSAGLALFAALIIAGVNFAQLGLFGGLIAAGVSVALRDTLGNFAAGIVLLWDGTIRKGDVITIDQPQNPETGGTYGIVEDVRLRYTLIRDRDTVHRLIPNSILINSVVENWTHDHDRKVRLKVLVPVPYGSNLKQVQNILESSCYEVGRVLTNPAPRALVVEFADSAILFSLRFWIRDPEAGIRAVISEVLSYSSERLSEVGIKIPFPQLDIHLKEALEEDHSGGESSGLD